MAFYTVSHLLLGGDMYGETRAPPRPPAWPFAIYLYALYVHAAPSWSAEQQCALSCDAGTLPYLPKSAWHHGAKQRGLGSTEQLA